MTDLSELNGPFKEYKAFRGPPIETMPKLLAEGYEPMSFRDVMIRRLEVLPLENEVTDAWWGSDIDTITMIDYAECGRYLSVFNGKSLAKEINPKSKLSETGGLLLESPEAFEAYAKRGGYVFKMDRDYLNYRDSLYEDVNREMTKTQVPKNDLWLAISGDFNDRELLEQYAHAVLGDTADEREGMSVDIEEWWEKNVGIYLWRADGYGRNGPCATGTTGDRGLDQDALLIGMRAVKPRQSK
jgi:hypothetical protein